MIEHIITCLRTGESRLSRARTDYEAALIAERTWPLIERAESFRRVEQESEADVVVRPLPKDFPQRANETFVDAARRASKNTQGSLFRRVIVRVESPDGKHIAERIIS